MGKLESLVRLRHRGVAQGLVELVEDELHGIVTLLLFRLGIPFPVLFQFRHLFFHRSPDGDFVVPQFRLQLLPQRRHFLESRFPAVLFDTLSQGFAIR